MIPESSAAAASRSAEQNRNSGAEASSSAAINHSEDDSGNENQQKSARRRKRAHRLSENVKKKRARAAGGLSGVSRAAGRRAGQKHVEAVTLFEVITMGKSAMQTVVDDWIEAYMADRDSSLLDLISFFIQCSGCKGVVTAEMCQSREDGDVRSKMVEELDEVAGLQYKKFLAFPWILTVTWPLDADSSEYPLVQSGPYGRWFHSEFCDFVSVLVSQCQDSVLFDGYLMSSVVSLLAELSDSYIRAFRHTCTLAAVKLLSALGGVALSLGVGIENSQKLHAVQRTKTARQKSTQQLEKIQKKTSELQEKRAEVESMMDVIFKGVFLKRYRDVLPEIRSVCVEELCLWMKLCSSVFLNDSYLKYVGWMLHDKAADVRLRCVLGLQGVYGDPLLRPKLDLFTSRFKDRIVSMTLDKDNEVSVQTMRLLLLMSRSSEDVLSLEDYQQLLQCVYSSQRPLAAAAGELLFSRILNAETDDQDRVNEEEVRKGQAFTRLKALLRFYQESKLHEHVVYLVDSLWDCGGALLKDWSALTSALLQDPSTPGPGNSPGFSLQEQEVLVEILVASVRQASEGPALVGRTGAKKVMNAREKKAQTDDCLKLTEHLLLLLPQLLSKFSCSADVVASLMKIPQFFLPECPEAEDTKAVDGLMAEMAAVLDLHSGPAVLEAAARSYLSLCGGGAAWCSTARASRDSLVRRWVEQLKGMLGNSVKADGFSADQETMKEILTTLKKLRAFHNCHDLSQWRLFDLLSPLLSMEIGQGGTPVELLQELLQCSSFIMLWSLNTSSQTLTCREKAVSQRLQLRLFCETSHRCLSHGDIRVRNQAFLGVCDVLTAHSYQLHVWDPSSFGPLLYTPSPKLQRALLTFICTNVFMGAGCETVREISEVEKLEDLHRRRNLLAAYCKMIIHGVLEMSMAAEVFMNYVKFYSEFGDIVKETLLRSRQVDQVESARALVVCLQQLFERLKRDQDGVRRTQNSGVQTFSSIKELARRFALSFGDLVKFRESVVMIHRNGIQFVFQESSQTEASTPAHLSYLTILSEFSNKLLRPDKKTVFSYLQKYTSEHAVDLREDSWQPLVHYRASLLAVAEVEDAASNVSSDRRPYLPARSPFSKKHEGGRSPLFSPGRGNRTSPSPSRQEKTSDLFSVLLEPPGRNLHADGSVLSISNEADDGPVEVEL